MSENVKMTRDDDARLLRLINATVSHKNTISKTEFGHFQPLFVKHNVPDDTATDKEINDYDEHVDNLRSLSSEWCMRISPYHEVHIVNDHDEEDVLETLPPITTRVPTLNESAGDHAGILIDALMNGHDRTDAYRDLVSPAAARVTAVMNAGIDTASVKKTQEVFDKHVNRIEGNSSEEAGEEEVIQDSESEIKNAMADAEWS